MGYVVSFGDIWDGAECTCHLFYLVSYCFSLISQDIVLCAGSDRSLEVFDMNVGRRLLIIEDVHARNAYCVKLNEVLNQVLNFRVSKRYTVLRVKYNPAYFSQLFSNKNFHNYSGIRCFMSLYSNIS